MSRAKLYFQRKKTFCSNIYFHRLLSNLKNYDIIKTKYTYEEIGSMRIQKFIAECGYCSRRAAETLIAQGKVTVNNSPAIIGMDIDPENDRVVCDGKRLRLKVCEKQYFMFYKPRGVITSMKAQDDRSVVGNMIKNVKGRVYPVGRLDRDSEGILILTDDGNLALRLTHPRYKVSKTYRVTVRGYVEESKLDQLRNGVELEDGMTLPAIVSVQAMKDKSGTRIDEYKETRDGFDDNTPEIAKTSLHITISEGRNRQIRRMCEAVGLEVVLLKRVAIGDLSIGHLAPGEYRPLSEKEKERLFSNVGLEYVRKNDYRKSSKNGSQRFGKGRSIYEKRVVRRLMNGEYKKK